MQKQLYRRRNICLGFIDGATIPLVVAAVLTRRSGELKTIIISCLAVAFVGAITMAVSSYIEGRKYERENFSAGSSVLIGVSYFAGGLVVAFPFFFIADGQHAFIISIVITAVALLIAGFIESGVYGAGSVWGVVRPLVIGALAAGAGYLVAGMG